MNAGSAALRIVLERGGGRGRRRAQPLRSRGLAAARHLRLLRRGNLRLLPGRAECRPGLIRPLQSSRLFSRSREARSLSSCALRRSALLRPNATRFSAARRSASVRVLGLAKPVEIDDRSHSSAPSRPLAAARSRPARYRIVGMTNSAPCADAGRPARGDGLQARDRSARLPGRARSGRRTASASSRRSCGRPSAPGSAR